MPRPGRPTTGKITKTIRMDPEQHQALRVIAVQQKTSLSGLIERAVTSYLAELAGKVVAK